MLNLYFGIVCMMSVQTLPQDNYTIELLSGDQMQEMLPFLAEWRLTFFHDYPYLYDGKADSKTLEREINYGKNLMSYDHAAIAVAYQGDIPIALLSGSSLVNFCDHFGDAEGFKAEGLDPKTFYYFAEIIVLPGHRGNGLCTRLFQLFEKWVIAQGYTNGCFVAESHEAHPLKPLDYKECDPLWRAMGYQKTNISTRYAWNTIQPDGSSCIQEHDMPYWVKQLVS